MQVKTPDSERHGDTKIIDFQSFAVTKQQQAYHQQDTPVQSALYSLLDVTKQDSELLQSAERLILAAKLIEEVAFDLAERSTGRNTANLLLVAAELEHEIEHLTGLRSNT